MRCPLSSQSLQKEGNAGFIRGLGDMLERVKDCKLKRMSGLGVERRRVLARKQELNMLSRAYDTSKSTCSREHAES